MRLFIAIQLTDEMKDSICDVQDQFRAQGVKGNYTSSENMHMTLAFIGEYNDPDKVLEALESVGFEPFTITMNCVGNFSDLWWTGIAESRELSNLARQVRHVLAEAGIPFDRKRFMPHMTILRKPVYTGTKDLKTNISTTKMKVDHISLMLSTRGKNGMIYTELGSVGTNEEII